MSFPRGIDPKVKVIARQEFELAYNDVPVQYVYNNTTGTPS